MNGSERERGRQKKTQATHELHMVRLRLIEIGFKLSLGSDEDSLML